MKWILGCLLLLPAPQEAAKVEAAIKKFGERTYRILEKGNAVGKCTLKSRIGEMEGITVAIFEDKIERTGDTPQVLDYTEKAALKGLRLRWATRENDGFKEDDPTVIIEEGDARVTSPEGNMTLVKVEGVRGERSLIRLLCMAEQKVGSVVQSDLLVLEPVDYQRRQEVKCVAAETIDVGGKKVATFKWVDKRKGRSILSGQPIAYDFDNAYWIAADGALVKFTSGSLEMVLESK
ncbi:MAG TPA: hypothetical protein VJU16_08805 [Planctomycetota bacterium]|nr:hypothetical protein [Planctomycetota bacterium]